MHGWVCASGFKPFAEVMAGAPAFKKAVEPDRAAYAVYSAMLDRYEKIEKRVIG